ncbi:MAG: DNA-directed RNA polymerase subunit beta', partial [Candidatus Peregrinibacteria bacterium]|nr:DNA-directed RNA polymerase subunit beta' [Candidatus Peregrinibacteria bacterium]
DMISPEEREGLIAEADETVRKINNQYWKGWTTDDERYHHAIRLWSFLKNDVTNKMIEKFEKNPENNIYYMIDSGARGNWGQITQLCGMKGLVANPSGKTIELPIKSNLKDGFSILEYFIATHGGRKGKSDTALKTAEAGYLTRRLVDAVQDIVIKENDCKQNVEHLVTREDSEKIGEGFEKRIFGRTLATPIVHPKTGEVIADKGMQVDNHIAAQVKEVRVDEVRVRGIMTCKVENGICQQCYGFDLGTNHLVDMGTAVGIIAAQSIGEPGTQLTMRTFHMGGVAEGGDITQGLTRVEELFEARNPRGAAVLADISGKITVKHEKGQTEVTITAQELGQDTYSVPSDFEIVVKKGEKIKAKQIIARSKGDKQSLKSTDEGKVIKVTDAEVVTEHTEKHQKVYNFEAKEKLLVKNNDLIARGTPMHRGHLNLQDLKEATDVYTAQKYIMTEVQHIYASQGQTINDKHIEIIVKQMFSKVRVVNPGDSNFLPGEVVNAEMFSNKNEELRKGKKKEANGERLLLGISRVAITTDSWLSAASFQETIRVLVEAATTRKIDNLKGLKENVIIGKLIPAGHVFKANYEQKNKS